VPEVTGMRGNPDNLRRAAARKSAAAQARAEHGLREMIRANEQITFRGLAQTAGVSLDFLYRCAPIRQRVEHLRAQQQNTPPPGATTTHEDAPSSVVRTLTSQLSALKQRHRDEVHQLRQALEAAQGEILELRRRLGHRRDIELPHLPAETDTPRHH
jgi:predicted RNase H-like nuclease (RuvC/YqgF family)